MECDFTTALGRLLTEPKLRAEFARNPVGTARALAVREQDIASLVALDGNGLETQAQTLLQKRLHEVRRLLPITFEQLGPDAPALFLSYAVGHWPEGHARHRLDAVQFCEFLLRRNVREVYLPEIHRARFGLTKQKCSVRFVRRYRVNGRPKCVVQVLYRQRLGTVRQFVLYFGLR